MEQDNMPTSSKLEDERYLVLKHDKNIKCLVRQLVFRACINKIDVFRYTADFAYLENGIKTIEEFKGYIYERHDFELRMKVCSALNPELLFKIVVGKKHKVYKVFKAGKAIRQKACRRKK